MNLDCQYGSWLEMPCRVLIHICNSTNLRNQCSCVRGLDFLGILSPLIYCKHCVVQTFTIQSMHGYQLTSLLSIKYNPTIFDLWNLFWEISQSHHNLFILSLHVPVSRIFFLITFFIIVEFYLSLKNPIKYMKLPKKH